MAMLFKRREQQVHDRVCREIDIRLDKAGAPAEIRAFLRERWSYLLAGIYMSHGDRHPDWEAGWHAVNALLWSVAPKRDQAQTELLLNVLPTLLERLHAGCEAMRLEAGERDRFFSQLAMLHAAVMRAGLPASRERGVPQTRLAGHLDAANPTADLGALGDPEQPVASMPAQTHRGIDALVEGDPVRFRSETGDKRLSLHWVSPMGGMYMFTDEEGFDAMTLTRARLAEKLAAGEAFLE